MVGIGLITLFLLCFGLIFGFSKQNIVIYIIYNITAPIYCWDSKQRIWLFKMLEIIIKLLSHEKVVKKSALKIMEQTCINIEAQIYPHKDNVNVTPTHRVTKYVQYLTLDHFLYVRCK